MTGAPFYRRIGVNVDKLRIILQTKCRVDDRRPPGLNIYKNTNKSPSKAGIYFTQFIMGSALAFILYIIPNAFTAHSIYFFAFLIYITTSLITDFSHVLLDVRDHYLIASRPVDDQTVSLARILHIFVYMCRTMGPFCMPGIAVVFIFTGILSGFLFLVELILITAISIFAVYIIYLAMMQVMKPQRFRDMVAYVQIGLTVSIFAFYYVVPQFVDLESLSTFSITDYTISYFLPPVWIAALQNIAAGSFTLQTSILGMIGLLAPAACMVVIVRFLSGNFSNTLSMLGASETDGTSGTQLQISPGQTLCDKAAGWLTSNPMEALGFKITWKLTSRLREFKVKVYPGFAFVFMYFFYFAFAGGDVSLSEKWSQLPDTSYYLFILYSIVYLAIIFLLNITRSSDYKAAWFYELSPNDQPGMVLSGMLKSLVTKFFLPIALVSSLFIFWIWGLGETLNIIFAMVDIMVIILILVLLRSKALPFSEPMDIHNQKGEVFYNFLFLIIPGLLGYGHYLISGYPLALTLLSVVFMILTAVLFRLYRNLTWQDILDE